MESIPALSADLIRELRRAYPAKAHLDIARLDPVALGEYCGQQSVVEFLETKQSLLSEDIPEVLNVR